MLLYFEDSKGHRSLISNPTTVNDMWKDIHCYLFDHNYATPNIKVSFDEKEWIINMNNWEEVFIVKHFDEEDLNEMMKGEWM